MKNLIFVGCALLFSIPVIGADAANDLILSQRNSGNTGNMQRNIGAAGAITNTTTFRSQLAIAGLTDNNNYTGTQTFNGIVYIPFVAMPAGSPSAVDLTKSGNVYTGSGSVTFTYSNLTPAVGTNTLLRIIASGGDLSVTLTTSTWVLNPVGGGLTTGPITVTNGNTLEMRLQYLNSRFEFLGYPAVTTGGGTAFLTINPSSTVGQVPRVTGSGTVAFGAVDFANASAVTGNLLIANFNSGTSASSSTAWFGDGTWKTVTSAAPGGSNTQVQFNDSSSFGGDAGFTYNKTTDRITSLGGITITQGQANTSLISSTGFSLTGSNATSLIDIAGTLNTSGNPSVIKYNITNTASGGSTFYFDYQVGGVSKFNLDLQGNGGFGGTVFASRLLTNGGGDVTFLSRGFIQFPSNGVMTISDNTAADFGLLAFGQALATYPALKRSGAGLVIRLGDDSANAALTAAAITATGLITPVETTGIKGTTTNNNASSGSWGEYGEIIVTAASAVTLSTGTTAEVTHITSLPVGDWEVWGVVYFTQGATTTATAYSAGLNGSAAVMPGNDTGRQANIPGTGAALVSGNPDPTIVIPRTRFLNSGTLDVYLVAQSTFLVSTQKAYGTIRYRRIR